MTIKVMIQMSECRKKVKVINKYMEFARKSAYKIKKHTHTLIWNPRVFFKKPFKSMQMTSNLYYYFHCH